MSIYYNHAQKYPLQHPPRNRSPQEDVSQRRRGRSPPGENFRDNAGNTGKAPRDSLDKGQMRMQSQLEEWQDIGNIQQPNNSNYSPKKQPQKQVNKLVPKKSPPKEGLKQKLSSIINVFQEEKSIAEITHFRGGSDHEDQLEQSTSTIQSNDRRRHASLPKRLQRQGRSGQEGGKAGKNREVVGQKIGVSDEFALQQKPVQESKSRPKYLFYRKVEEQQDKSANKHPFTNPKQQAQYSAEIQQAIQVEKLPDYEYVKDEHPPKQKKKTHLKNKLGFIVDLFHKQEEAASVSYYSDSQQESMEIKAEKVTPPPPPAPLPQKKEQKQAVVQNVFEHSSRQEEGYEPETFTKPKSKVLINTQINKSAEFEDLNIPVSPIQKIQEAPVQTITIEEKQSIKQREQPNGITPTESAFLKIKRSIKINNSLQRIQLEMAQINRNRSKSKLSATKSVQNNLKPQRYKDGAEEDLQNVEMRGKKKSMDQRHLSRHIQKSINRQSSSVPSNDYQQRLSKSKSAQSKFSIKLMEMQLKKSSQRQAKSISDKHPVSPKAPSLKKSQQQPFQDDSAVKKAFPIARKESLSKNNPNYSKYMRINFKESSESHDNDVMAEDIPSTTIKKTQQIQRLKPNDPPFTQNIQISPNLNTGQDTTKISLKPVNKVEFSIDRAKRFNTEIVQKKEELSQQEKKFLALLKKREEALLKRVKEQVLNNNPSTIIRDNIQQRSKGFSNDTFEKIVVKDQSSSNKSPKNYYQAQRRDKMSLKSQQPKDAEVKAYFPTLNMSPSKQPQYETFYNGSPLKRNNSKNINYIRSKKKGLSEPISSDSEMSKTIEDRMEEIRNIRREPSKIGYYNIKKLHKESSLNEKNFSSKEKYERLKQLLQKI